MANAHSGKSPEGSAGKSARSLGMQGVGKNRLNSCISNPDMSERRLDVRQRRRDEMKRDGDSNSNEVAPDTALCMPRYTSG